jgi:hypothetical protein
VLLLSGSHGNLLSPKKGNASEQKLVQISYQFPPWRFGVNELFDEIQKDKAGQGKQEEKEE